MINKNSIPIKNTFQWYVIEKEKGLTGFVLIFKEKELKKEIKTLELNTTACLVFEKIDGNCSIKEIEEHLKNIFINVDPVKIEKDVDSIINFMIENNMIILNYNKLSFLNSEHRYYFY